MSKFYLFSLVCFFFYNVSFAQANHHHHSMEITCLAVNPNGDLYAGTSNGLYHLVSGDSTWYLVDNGLPTNTLVNAIHINSVEHIFIGYYYYQGVFRSTNGGDNWTPIGRTNMSVYCFESKIPDTVFCGGDAGGALFRSYNNGNNWTKIGNFYYVRTLGISNAGDIYLGTTSNGIWKSEDNGNNWIQTGLGNFYYVWAIAFNSLGAIYAGTEQHGVFKSLDGGQSWIQTNDGLLNTNVFSIAINYNDDLFAGTLGGLYVFNADSNHWQASLPNLAVGDIVIDSHNTIYAGTNLGVYSSDDNGANWTPLPPILITGIEGSQSQTLKSIILKQNYPNPFNPTTSIQYSVDGNHHVLLRIYDLFGKEITTLVNEKKQTGMYTVKFDANKLSSGIYFYQLQAGGFTEAKKMIFMR